MSCCLHFAAPAGVTVCCMRRWASIPEWEAYSLSEIARRSHLPWVRLPFVVVHQLTSPSVLIYFYLFLIFLDVVFEGLHCSMPCSTNLQTRPRHVLHVSLLATLSLHGPLSVQHMGVAAFSSLTFSRDLHSKTSGLLALVHKLFRLMHHLSGHWL